MFLILRSVLARIDIKLLNLNNMPLRLNRLTLRQEIKYLSHLGRLGLC